VNLIEWSIEYLKQNKVKGVVDGTASGPCVVCNSLESVMNSHHTVPRACGGNKSMQVNLCATHHDILHAQAVYIISSLKNKKQSKQFWANPQLEAAALPLLNVLVRALMVQTEQTNKKRNLVSIDIGQELKNSLKLLSKDLQMSQTNALTYCLIYTLKSKGILSDDQYRKISSGS
jgi:hypothetical protein